MQRINGTDLFYRFGESYSVQSACAADGFSVDYAYGFYFEDGTPLDRPITKQERAILWGEDIENIEESLKSFKEGTT